MVTGIGIFSLYGAPLIACIAWLVSLLRLRSAYLLALTAIAIVLMLITSSNVILAITLNPYLMLVLTVSALWTMAVLPADNREKRAYIIRANAIFLLMILALHLWAIYLRQSELYFYEQSDFWARAFPVLLTALSVMIPIVGIGRFVKKWRGNINA